jgi:hypothetical protein
VTMSCYRLLQSPPGLSEHPEKPNSTAQKRVCRCTHSATEVFTPSTLDRRIAPNMMIMAASPQIRRVRISAASQPAHSSPCVTSRIKRHRPIFRLGDGMSKYNPVSPPLVDRCRRSSVASFLLHRHL